jgi:hypothetical protein
MGAIQPPTRDLDHRNGLRREGAADLDAPEVWPELDAELVTRLTKLVIRNVVDRSEPSSVGSPREHGYEFASPRDHTGS